jgi:iron complex transport system permease protein
VLLDRTVLLQIRIPRLLFAALLGAALSVSGCVLQGVFRNPLVSPSILGLSSGAGFGAALAIVAFGSSAWAVQGSAFFFALCAVVLAMLIGRAAGRHPETSLILAGIAVSALFSSLLTLLQTVADPERQLPSIVFWTMGGFARATWGNAALAFPPILVGSGILLLYRWKLNLLSMGDLEARSMGVEPGRIRTLLIACASLIVAAGVAVCGTIAWVGLVVPHTVRLLVGADHARVVPLSLAGGAIFLLIVDALSRSVFSVEIPVGVLTSFVGAPFFVALLLRQGRKRRR